jgi:hypothetical protein
MRCSAHFLSSSRQAARDRALELTGPDSKRPRATHQLDLEAEAEVKRERRKDRKEDDARRVFLLNLFILTRRSSFASPCPSSA